jgi:hypothetical protein
VTDVVIEDFKLMTRNSLRGFARVRMPSGVIYHDCAVHQRGSIRWASPASKPMIGAYGTQMRGADGKAAWQPIISFVSKEVRDQFSRAIVAAIEAAHPECFRD